MHKSVLSTFLLFTLFAAPASALDRPWIGDVFFYWYTWDDDVELGSWMSGIHNTPLSGYYDSRTFRDNRHSLWQASEWGQTHHFMDYWVPHWKGEDGQMREAVVMRAAESLRKSGYNIWMAYYQDGENFEMREFSRNVSEKRDVHQWLRDFAGSEVWPKIAGRPFQLVYGRNGRPETTLDHEGFRRFLEERYENVVALNRAWQTDFSDFDRIEMSFSAVGHHRAESIEYQYLLWRREWEKLDRLVEKEFGLPGIKASFDVGYGPYNHYGFANFARTFGGPHSYAGIFDQPHDQDAERFIQAAVAKKYDTVFLDHFKNYYFDWNIRVPGMAYLPEPHHFDRFWVGALARHSEALLHLSWNEWWEGSNLEPCREYGKTYCEKNLLYSTLMQLAFDSIRTAGEGAPVAVILNDWRFASGASHAEELYGVVQILRRLGVPFDLLPDDLVTAERLEDFQLVVAPAYGCGLGYNGRREPIAEVLAAWLGGADRRLIVSAHPTLAEQFGFEEGRTTSIDSAKPGGDLNVFVDVGAEGDETFLRSGHSRRETGMRFDDDVTFRWTPAAGRQTSCVLPASPHRDHVLRLRGNAFWPNSLSVVLNGRVVGTMKIRSGPVMTQFEVPAEAIGPAPMVSLELHHAQMHVPSQKAPEQYGGEGRVCNLSLNSLQWSTANVAPGWTEPQYRMVDDSLRLTGPLFEAATQTAVAVPYQRRPRLSAGKAQVLSEMNIGGLPRDLVVPFGPSQVLYVNGSLAEIESDDYWLPILHRWAGVDFHRFVRGEHCMSARLRANDTDFLVLFNEDITEPRQIDLLLPPRDVPLAEAAVLSRDGLTWRPLPVISNDRGYQARDTLGYYAVYQFAFSPVRIELPELALQPGESKAFSAKVANLTDAPVRGRIQAASVIPTVTGEPQEIELGPRETQTVKLTINVAPTTDWGKKTIYIEQVFGNRRAIVLRELTVQKPTEVELADVVLDPSDPRVELRVPDNPYGETASLSGACLTLQGQTINLPDIPEGGSSKITLRPFDLAAASQPRLDAAKLRIDLGLPGARRTIDQEVFLPRRPNVYPRQSEASALLVVFNPRATPLAHEPLTIDLPTGLELGSVRSQEGEPIPWQIDPAGRLRFLGAAPARSARLVYLCPSRADAPTDLECKADNLGSGNGTLAVENSHLSILLSEASGGTVTRLVSRKTDRDYGQDSLGIDYGTFSQRDPTEPQTNTVDYIHESKTRQKGSPGRIELLSKGPATVVARVRWADPKVRVEQLYEFPAHQPYFTIRQQVRPIDLADQQELVALDARFNSHRLTKSFPNFVGVVNDKEQPHFGWREGGWAPDYATLMTPNEFDESLSLVITQSRGLTGIRQGFWPAERPKSGKCAVAQIELLADPTTGCDFETRVLLHAGHQIVAKRFLNDLRTPPRVDIVADPQWIPSPNER
ncbi:MAG: hypothetical protein HQ582_29340 [Planctomycetes bacterium]|nr:hypothetical protein [Planctomycetota bacterium]